MKIAREVIMLCESEEEKTYSVIERSKPSGIVYKVVQTSDGINVIKYGRNFTHYANDEVTKFDTRFERTDKTPSPKPLSNKEKSDMAKWKKRDDTRKKASGDKDD